MKSRSVIEPQLLSWIQVWPPSVVWKNPLPAAHPCCASTKSSAHSEFVGNLRCSKLEPPSVVCTISPSPPHIQSSDGDTTASACRSSPVGSGACSVHADCASADAPVSTMPSKEPARAGNVERCVSSMVRSPIKA
jgi:hypothetical protein